MTTDKSNYYIDMLEIESSTKEVARLFRSYRHDFNILQIKKEIRESRIHYLKMKKSNIISPSDHYDEEIRKEELELTDLFEQRMKLEAEWKTTFAYISHRLTGEDQ